MDLVDDALPRPPPPQHPPANNAPSVATALQRFTFSGSGGEYFRIWIVNLLLTIVTLGIYSAWAKVRKTRYVYGNTQVAGSSFDYHGNPFAILKGRIVALVLLAGYQFAFKFSALLGFAALAVMMAVLPWLIWKSLQFKTYNSSYRGIRFSFSGSARSAYRVFLLLPVLTVFTLYLLTPFTHQRIKKFQHDQSRFGSTHFSFHATAGAFYVAYLIVIAFGVAGGIALGVLLSAAGAVARSRPGSILFFLLAVYAWLFVLVPIFLAMLQNLIWNNTRLAQHAFKSELRVGKMVFIYLTNVLAIIATLGVFIPFAQMRSLRYRIESMSLITAGTLDEFVAHTQANVSATGEGMADLLDFDLSL